MLAAVLGAVLSSLVSVTATLALTGRLPRPDRRWARWAWAGLLTLWPVLLIGCGFLIAYGLPNNWDFPSQEFYTVAAEAIVLLLLGLIIEHTVLADLHWLHRLEYGFILMVGEGAALLAISGSPPVDLQEDSGWTVTLSTLTVTALLSASVLVLAAVARRAQSELQRPEASNA